MNAKEKELVTLEFVQLETNYNLCVGGKGGWSYINMNLQNGMLGKQQTHKQKDSASELMMLMHTDKEWHHRITSKGGNNSTGFTGFTHSPISKQKMSGPRQTSCSESNSQFGTMWITNGAISKKITKYDIIQDGWYKGRTV